MGISRETYNRRKNVNFLWRLEITEGPSVHGYTLESAGGRGQGISTAEIVILWDLFRSFNR